MKTYRLVRTDQFDESLRELIAYIKQDSPVNASMFLDGVIDAIEHITPFPEKAFQVSPGVRVKFFKGFWIPYHIDGNTIYILDILHPRHDTKARRYRTDA